MNTSAMQRRNFLKLIGVSGVGVAIAAIGETKTEESVTSAPDNVIRYRNGEIIYNLPMPYSHQGDVWSEVTNE